LQPTLPLKTCWQPLPGLQLSFVHGSLSLQFGGAPPTHVPEPLHWSPVVQAFASSHEVPEARAHVSGVSLQVCAQNARLVHGLPAWAEHVPPEQLSAGYLPQRSFRSWWYC